MQQEELPSRKRNFRSCNQDLGGVTSYDNGLELEAFECRTESGQRLKSGNFGASVGLEAPRARVGPSGQR